MSDLSLIYFVVQALTLLLFFHSVPEVFTLFSIVSIFGILFIPYSIYQQKVIIKKWCSLCLCALFVLLSQAIISCIYFTSTKVQQISFILIVLVVLITAATLLIWGLLLPLLKKNITHKDLQISNLSFRRNYHLLFPYLQNQCSLQSFVPINSIHLGNPNSKLNIISITNPLCQSCVETHKILNSFLSKYKELSVQLIFYVPLTPTDPRTIIAGHFLKQCHLGNSKVITECYENTNPNIFIKKYGASISKEEIEILYQHREWCHTNNVFSTPTLILNGKCFPVFYKPTDIQYFIEELLSASCRYVNEEVSNKVLVDNT